MKLLLTSAGISNNSIRNALIELLGKPIAESSALFIPTAIYAIPHGPDIIRKVILGSLGDPFCELGWKSLGILELSVLPSIKQELWLPMLQETDVLLVGGGDCQYLTYWMQQSGLAALLPSLLSKIVYVGLSAGSMIMTRYGTTYGHHVLPATTDKSLGLLDFAIHPHLDHEWFPDNSLTNIKKLAATIPIPSYAIDDQTAIKVQDGSIEVISEGQWQLFNAKEITLRKTEISDLEYFFNFQLDEEACYLAAFTPKDRTDKTAYIQKYTRFLNDPTINMRTILADGIIAGSIAKYETQGEAEITYWIDKKFWGKGIATKALQAFLTIENTRPIFGRTAFDNPGSQKVLEKCGFMKIGTDTGFANARQAEIEEFIYKLI